MLVIFMPCAVEEHLLSRPGGRRCPRLTASVIGRRVEEAARRRLAPLARPRPTVPASAASPCRRRALAGSRLRGQSGSLLPLANSCGSWPWKPARIVPCSPTNRIPSLDIATPCASISPGRRGLMPPSYQNRSRAGRPPRRRTGSGSCRRSGRRSRSSTGRLTLSTIEQVWVAQASALDGDAEVQLGEDGPQAVDPHVGHRAAAEVVPAAEDRVRVVRVIGAVQRGPQPEVPVEALGNRRPVSLGISVYCGHTGRFVQLWISRSGADHALLDPRGDQPVARSRCRRPAGASRPSSCGRSRRPAGPRASRLARGLCIMTCLPFFIAAMAIGGVEVVGRHDLHRVQVLLLVEQLAEVGVGGARLELVRHPLRRA